MNKLILILLLCFASSSFALTDGEKIIVLRVKAKIELAAKQFAEAQNKVAQADQRATDAEKHAKLTDVYSNDLELQIDAAHKREQANANLAAKFKDFWDKGHKWGGIGAILLGIGMIIKNLLFLGIGLIVLCLVLFGLSFVFPILKPIFAIIGAFFKSVLAKITSIFKK